MTSDGYMAAPTWADSLGRKYVYEKSGLSDLFRGGQYNDAQFGLNEIAPAYRNSFLDLIRMNEPGNIAGRIGNFQDKAMSRARGIGERSARTIGRGYGSSVQDSLKLNAMNEGTRAGNNYAMQELGSPAEMTRNAMLLQMLGNYNPWATQQAAGVRQIQNRPPGATGLQIGAQLLATAAGAGAFNNVLGGGGGGGKAA
jgi:hypothetical protein